MRSRDYDTTWEGYKVLCEDGWSLNGKFLFSFDRINRLPPEDRPLDVGLWGFHFGMTPLDCMHGDAPKDKILRYVRIRALGRVVRKGGTCVTDAFQIFHTVPREAWRRMRTGFVSPLGTGMVAHYVEGRLSDAKDGTPAITRKDGGYERYRDGLLHSEDDLPTTVSPDGKAQWFRYGLKERGDDKPCVDWIGKGLAPKDFVFVWCKKGMFHRTTGGPARCSRNGDLKEWYKKGLLHNEQGPARILTERDGNGKVTTIAKEWCIRGVTVRMEEIKV